MATSQMSEDLPIYTVKALREAIADLPDDLHVLSESREHAFRHPAIGCIHHFGDGLPFLLIIASHEPF